MIINIIRKPSNKNVCQSLLSYETGALNIDKCRITKRWPANILLSESVVKVMDDQSGVLRARGNKGCSKGGGGLYGHKETVNNFGFGDAGGASRSFKVLG